MRCLLFVKSEGDNELWDGTEGRNCEKRVPRLVPRTQWGPSFTFWWASSAALPPHFFLTVLLGHSLVSRSLDGFSICANDNQKMSSERNGGWENVASIPAPRCAATAWERFAEDSNQQKDGIYNSVGSDYSDLFPLETRGKGLATLLKVVLSGSYSILGHTVRENLRTETIFHLMTSSNEIHHALPVFNYQITQITYQIIYLIQHSENRFPIIFSFFCLFCSFGS